MKRLHTLIPILGIAAAGLFGGASCGDNSVACGEGTVAENGYCVPADTGPDTSCGTGTVLDPGTESCVPDGSVICEQGTVFEDGQCVVDEDACAAGTVLVDGQCLPEDDTLTADLEEAAEPNDDAAAPAGMFTIGAVDTSTVIHGCVNPRGDADGDGNLDADFDLWFVNATGPTTLELTADGVGGLSAGFVMVNGDPGLANALANWRRFGINLTGDTAQRQVFLPAAGTYALLMTDARSLFLGSGAAGSETACYYTTVKRVATPAATPLTTPSTETDDRGQVKLFSFNPASEGRILDVSLNTASAAMFPAFLVLRGQQNTLYGSVRGDGTTTGFFTVGGLDQGETITLVSDMEYNYALSPQGYSYDAFDIVGTELPAAGTLTLTKRNGQTPTAPYADLHYLYFDVAQAGQILNFNVTAANMATPPGEVRLDMVITRRDVFTPAGAFDTIAVIDAFGSTGRTGGFANQFVRFAQPGRYYFIVQDPTGISGDMFTVTASHAVTPVSAVQFGTPQAATALPANNNAFHSLDLTNPTWLGFGVTGTGFPTGTATARLTFYDLAGTGWLGGNYASVFTGTQNADGSAPLGRIMVGETRDFLVRVEPTAAPSAGATYALDIKNRDHHDFQVITPGTPINRNGMDMISVGQVKRFLVVGPTGSTLNATVTPTAAGADTRIRQLGVTENNITPSTPASNGDQGFDGEADTLTTLFGSAPANWVAFTVDSWSGSDDTNLNIVLNATAPPYVVTNNTGIPWTNACNGVGSTMLGTDLDDDFTARRPIGFDFPLFGVTTTHYIVNANGLLALGDMTLANPACSSTGCWSNAAIPTSSAPNNFVAPFWDDADGMTICVKEEATKLTVQWVGNHYLDGTLLGPKISAQAILNANGTINYVWNAGAEHADTGSSATIGVENANGSLGVQISHNTSVAVAGTSKTLTPPAP